MSRYLWRRLDVPGHDACELSESPGGWRLAGTAVFLHENGPARIEYKVECDRQWVSRHGELRGWIGDDRWKVIIERSEAGVWYLNGWNVPGLEDVPRPGLRVYAGDEPSAAAPMPAWCR